MRAITPEGRPKPTSRLGYLPAHNLRIICRRCRRVVLLDCKRLAIRHGREAIVQDVAARLRCETCGSPPSLVELAPKRAWITNMGVPIMPVRII